jgi:hypothetical protein
VGVCPAHEDCLCDDAGKQAEEHKQAEGGEGMPYAAGITRVAKLMKNLGKRSKYARVKGGHLYSLKTEIKGRTRPLLRRKKKNVGKSP